MYGILEKTSSRRKCKHGVRRGQTCEGVLERIVGIEREVIANFGDIAVGDILLVQNDIIDVIMTDPVELIKLVDNDTMEFITHTSSYIFKIIQE